MLLCRSAIAFLAALAAAFANFSTAASAEPFRLIVTDIDTPLVPNSVMYLAKPLGFYERAGVEVELVRVQQTPSAVAALKTGEGDMANIATEAALRLVASGQMDLKAVVSPNKSLPFLIASSQKIELPAELAGRSFGIGRPGSLDHSLSREVLRHNHVDTGTMKFVALGAPDIRARALASGNVEATTMSIGTWLSMPSHDGLHVLVPQQAYFEAAPIVSKVNVVRAETLRDKRDQVERVIRALIATSRAFAEKPELWVEAMAKARPDMERDDLTTLAESFSGSWSVNGGMNREELERTQRFVFSGEAFRNLKPPELESWVSFELVDSVLKEDGIATGSDRPLR